MKVKNMISRKGNAVANQFIIDDDNGNTFFQSYKSIIAKVNFDGVFLDKTFWDYSATTAKYRREFLNEGVEDTRNKIKCGLYKLVDLNTETTTWDKENPNCWRS
ncbi:hypothetical protein HOQ51_gp42 [uncultured phage_MedDCM-OCT-S35-C6]|uniref:DUF8033 domain-containing protein n=1 Tax=uncultured phage_MedDCM-OCT-S35-C6 TaxID=2741075 RepID=A0A6S4PID3_9CAUD|nr:hypothetical protein HOQ51_gp42 [uncultured phage_MedDCM-OCT-S35-C6]BAQ94176.1 hypothetical protein [uncultured phage_MedDCM-OCT-S35-C6]